MTTFPPPRSICMRNCDYPFSLLQHRPHKTQEAAWLEELGYLCLKGLEETPTDTHLSSGLLPPTEISLKQFHSYLYIRHFCCMGQADSSCMQDINRLDHNRISSVSFNSALLIFFHKNALRSLHCDHPGITLLSWTNYYRQFAMAAHFCL